MNNYFKNKENIRDILKIDGSFGEGGGSILRVAVGLASIIGCPIEITNIRKNRSNPGLRLQHLVGIQTLTSLTGGNCNYLQVGSTLVKFSPGDQWKNALDIQIETAGNIGLLTQTLHNGLYLSKNTIQDFQFHVKGGGTYGTFAPGISYLNNVTYQIFEQMGFHVNIDVIRHGFYPKGGAEAKIIIHPKNSFIEYTPIFFEERGKLVEIQGIIHANKILEAAHVGERIRTAVLDSLKKNSSISCDIVIETQYHDTYSVGVGADLWAVFSNGERMGTGTILGERGVSSEKIGKKLAQEMTHILNGTFTMDEHAADQIIPLLCLIPKPSCFTVASLSSHLTTNIELMKLFTNREPKIQRIGNNYKIQYE